MRALPLKYERKEDLGEKGFGKRKKGVILEPKSVLDQRSPSPPTSTSTSTLSSSRFTDTAGVAAVSDQPAFKWPNAADEEEEYWPSLEMDWDTILLHSESTTASSPGQQPTFLRSIMGDQQQHPILSSPTPTSMLEFETGFALLDPPLGFEPNAPADKNHFFTPNSLPLSMPPAMFYQEPAEEKPQFFDPNLLFNQFHQAPVLNPGFFLPLPSMDNHNLLPTRGSELFPRQQPNQSLNYPYSLQHRPLKPKCLLSGENEAQQGLVEQLMKVAELVEAGNLVSANGILARLNHQLPSAIGKPFLRSAFYFKEALQLLVNSSNPQAPTSSPHHHHRRTPLATPLDVVLKLSAYKAFSEVSPILQFTNFTATQALLEELGAADCIHIIDFDIGVGGQWSSFMQELSQRRSSSSSPISLLKITAFVSPYAFHPLELHLTKENLSHFAADLNIPFEINIASIESFDPADILVLSAGSNEDIAVNLSVGVWQGPFFPTLLRLVKQLLPKIVISMDQGCDRGDLLFSHYLLHSLQSCVVLLDSFDAAGTDQDVINKIERFVLQPRIENCVIGRAAEKMLPWRTLFASAGFLPFQFSNFTETQAECLLKRVQVRGFHVEKRQATLYLYWQRGELASVSAWRC